MSISVSFKNTPSSPVCQEILRSESKVITERMCRWRWQESNFPALFAHLAVSSWLPRSDVRRGASAHNQGIDRTGAVWTFSPHLQWSCRLDDHTGRTEHAFPLHLFNVKLKPVECYSDKWLNFLIKSLGLFNVLDFSVFFKNILYAALYIIKH